MIFDDPIEEYLSQVKLYSKQFFPSSIFILNYLRSDRVSARVEIAKRLFVDLYFNSTNGRKDYSLIQDNKRILGWDNLGGWHQHPASNPDKHIKGKEPGAKLVFQKMKELLSGK